MKKSIQTTSNSSQFGIQNWQSTTVAAPSLVPERSGETNDFFKSLWPASNHYVSQLNPVFLLDLPSMASLSPKDSWLVRDGLLPLIWFYSKNPVPGNFHGKLRVHEDFEAFVPEAWREQTELYRLFSGGQGGYLAARAEPQSSPQAKARELLLTGLIMPSVCSLDTLENDLKNIVRTIGASDQKKRQDLKIRAFLPIRYEYADKTAGHGYYNRYMQTLCKFLGTDIEFLELESLQWLHLPPGTLMHEFNEKWLYADSYLTLLALSKGCRLLTEGKRTFHKVYPLYPNVSCGIRNKFEKKFIDYLGGDWVPESQENAQNFFKTVNSSANRSYPWPKWFSSWCQDFTLLRAQGPR